ncbi:hypothetical protein LQ327_00135 [Actinomycetospora endophytica]|uniref:ClpA/ClpB-like protein n=1 Tax=Actinomycetospora endophytica TaxID=2291215 RepID=A0ABS8P421_9PSEU|nr:hypothetical protein [Actinomycetospora endophytica]MCD2191799.1 hypothetical protein [Actinomycetospora endophytica]
MIARTGSRSDDSLPFVAPWQELRWQRVRSTLRPGDPVSTLIYDALLEAHVARVDLDAAPVEDVTVEDSPIYQALVDAFADDRAIHGTATAPAGKVLSETRPAVPVAAGAGVRLGQDATWVVQLAEWEASASRDRRVDTGHVLLGLLSVGGEVGERLWRAGIELSSSRRMLTTRNAAPGDRHPAAAQNSSRNWGIDAAWVLATAREVAAARRSRQVEPADLLEALVRRPGRAGPSLARLRLSAIVSS